MAVSSPAPASRRRALSFVLGGIALAALVGLALLPPLGSAACIYGTACLDPSGGGISAWSIALALLLVFWIALVVFVVLRRRRGTPPGTVYVAPAYPSAPVDAPPAGAVGQVTPYSGSVPSSAPSPPENPPPSLSGPPAESLPWDTVSSAPVRPLAAATVAPAALAPAPEPAALPAGPAPEFPIPALAPPSPPVEPTGPTAPVEAPKLSEGPSSFPEPDSVPTLAHVPPPAAPPASPAAPPATAPRAEPPPAPLPARVAPVPAAASPTVRSASGPENGDGEDNLDSLVEELDRLGREMTGREAPAGSPRDEHPWAPYTAGAPEPGGSSPPTEPRPQRTRRTDEDETEE